MGLVCIDSILEMFMLVNGQMGRAMDVESILVRMVVGMLENSSGVLNMVLATTISGNNLELLML